MAALLTVAFAFREASLATWRRAVAQVAGETLITLRLRTCIKTQ
jgi:hypothetical protein